MDITEQTVIPTTSQQAATRYLCHFETSRILTWLEVIRSLRLGYRHFSQSEFLTAQQIDALSALRYCDNHEISAWLHHARNAGLCSSFSSYLFVVS